MAEPLTLAVLLDQLSRHRLRATKVDFFASGYVATFAAVPVDAPPMPQPAREEEPPEPDPLERFVHRKDPRP